MSTETTHRVRPSRSDTPAPPNLNLDALEREQSSEPFVFVHKGTRYELAHPATLDAFDFLNTIGLAEPKATIETLRLVMGDSEFAAFRASKPTFGAMQALVARFFDYAGVNQGN